MQIPDNNKEREDKSIYSLRKPVLEEAPMQRKGEKN
jgi:hypothetical protein